MPLYRLRCTWCGYEKEEHLSFHEFDTMKQFPEECPLPDTNDPNEQCIGVFVNVISPPAITHGLIREPTYNPAVGQYVSSDAEFRSALARASDAESERTGVAHNYQPLDSRDPIVAGVDGSGLEETYTAETKAGIREAKKYV